MEGGREDEDEDEEVKSPKVPLSNVTHMPSTVILVSCTLRAFIRPTVISASSEYMPRTLLNAYLGSSAGLDGQPSNWRGAGRAGGRGKPCHGGCSQGQAGAGGGCVAVWLQPRHLRVRVEDAVFRLSPTFHLRPTPTVPLIGGARRCPFFG